MAHYILSDQFMQLPETEGILENISGVAAEITVNPTAQTGHILYPFMRLAFSSTIYAARAKGEAGTAVIATFPIAVGTSPQYIDNPTNTLAPALCCCCDDENSTVEVEDINSIIEAYFDEKEAEICCCECINEQL